MKLYTLTVRENIVANDKVVSHVSRQETVEAEDVTHAVKQVEAAIKKAQPEHAKNHEVVGVMLTAETATAAK